MIHIVTAVNRAVYARQIEEMHRLRWRYYVEERGWRELREMQAEEGFERDQYDDDRAVYIMGIDADGSLMGSARLRPTDCGSLLGDRFAHLIDDPDSFKPSPRVWEITRMMRRPENRTKDNALRFAMNTAMVEAALSRGVHKLVGTGDSFWVPSARSLWRHKFRPMGLPQPYPEGEVIGLEFAADEEALAMLREAAGFVTPQMFEIPATVPGRVHDPALEERVARFVAMLPPEGVAETAAWLEQRAVGERAKTEIAS